VAGLGVKGQEELLTCSERRDEIAQPSVLPFSFDLLDGVIEGRQALEEGIDLVLVGVDPLACDASGLTHGSSDLVGATPIGGVPLVGASGELTRAGEYIG
jgi:hypothetical protein